MWSQSSQQRTKEGNMEGRGWGGNQRRDETLKRSSRSDHRGWRWEAGITDMVQMERGSCGLGLPPCSHTHNTALCGAHESLWHQVKSQEWGMGRVQLGYRELLGGAQLADRVLAALNRAGARKNERAKHERISVSAKQSDHVRQTLTTQRWLKCFVTQTKIRTF